MTFDSSLNRRTFVRRALGASAGLLAPRLAMPKSGLYANSGNPKQLGIQRARGGDTVRVALVMASGPSSAQADLVASCRHGAQLGLEEAARAAALLRTSLAILPAAHDAAGAGSLIRESPAAVIVAGDGALIAELGVQTDHAGVVLINCLSADDALRNVRCARMTFHVGASDAMRSDALRMAASSAGEGSSSTTVELWDASLERFGAAQLNDRFRARFPRGMDSAAWAGWFAVKAVWEASQRARAADGASIATYLERDTTAFDGHKGVALSFRRWDHQLRQPLYVTSTVAARSPHATARRTVVVVPSESARSRAVLDALGATAETTTCQWR